MFSCMGYQDNCLWIGVTLAYFQVIGMPSFLNRRCIMQLGKAVMRLAGRVISVTLTMVENNWLDRLQYQWGWMHQ